MRSFPASIVSDYRAPPAAPSIAVSITGTTATVTVTGSSAGLTHVIKYAALGAVWSTSGTRTGDGDITISSLTELSTYIFVGFSYIDSMNNLFSLPSDPIRKFVSDSAADTTIETALVSLLKGDAAVTALVSTRIYANFVKQSVSMPAITYQQISGIRSHTTSGKTGFCEARYQITCWSDNYGETRDIAEVVRKLLDAYTGTVNTRYIQNIQLIDEGDMPSMIAGVDVLRRYGKRLDFIIWYDEPKS